MIKNARYAAAEALTRVSRTRLPLPVIFDRVVEECRLNNEDRHLAMKICFGVLRNREYLSNLILRLCTQPLKKIKPFVYHALETGLFQLCFLDRIPPSAAVNETVKAIRSAGFPERIQGFVNAILRQSLRERTGSPDPHESWEASASLLNHPQWLTDRWTFRYGLTRMRRICLHNNREPVLCLRTTPRTTRAHLLALLQEAGIEGQPGQFAPDALLLPGYHGSIVAIPGYSRGYFQVQDQAAQLATLLLAPFLSGNRYLDCCAGLGGKTTHLVALAQETNGHVTAVEPDPGRFRLLRENITRTTEGDTVTIRQESLARFARICQLRFDGILVDAPCSGTGVIGRQPDIRWSREARDLMSFQQRQIELLEQAGELLVPGGTLVYAVCSIEPEENLDVISRFIGGNNRFTLSDCSKYLPESAHAFIEHKCFAPLPAAGIDGFFAARLTKSD